MSILITLLVYALILGLVWWVITLIPLPPPFRVVAQVVFAVIVIILLISLLTGGGLGLGALSLR